jgi:hypothetical protein
VPPSPTASLPDLRRGGYSASPRLAEPEAPCASFSPPSSSHPLPLLRPQSPPPSLPDLGRGGCPKRAPRRSPMPPLHLPFFLSLPSCP